jgi:protein O-mannosyl-transferase
LSSSATAGATATAIQPAAISSPGRLLDSRAKRNTVLCLLLALLTLAFYNPVIHNGFTNLDDNAYIAENVHVRAGLTWGTVKWAFASGEGGNWHPLTWLSHALDYELFKQNPAGHHYVNVLLHAMNALLLFLLLESVTGFTWPSFMVAALFALHPLNVESVAWASERKNVLSMLFFLLTLHAYGWYVRRESVGRYLAVAALFALGLMAKPEIITLPFVLLLWDYWPLRRMFDGQCGGKAQDAPVSRSFAFLCVEKIPLMLLSAGSAVITLLTQRASSAVRDASNRVRFGNAVVAYVRYMGKALWPTRLAALYPHPGRFLPTWQIFACAAVLIVLTVLVLRWRDRRYLVVGWFWFLGTMVPVVGIVQVGVQAMADRYAYLSFIGLFVCVVWGVAEITRERKIPAAWLAAPAVVILATLGILTRQQISYWHDSESLWRHALSVTQRNYFAHNLLAYALEDQGRTEDAIVEFDASEALHQYSPSALVAVGIFEQTHGHVQEAIEQYTQSLNASTDAKSRAEALGHLGSALIQVGDVARARMSYASALQQDPDNGVALVGNGLLAERDGDFGSAVAQISHAMQAAPTGVGYVLLAQALRRAGRLAEAEGALAQAQRISPDLAKSEQSAARVLITVGIKTD